MTGGEGNDTFNVKNSTASSFSTIEDFTTGEDKIECGATDLDISRFDTPLQGDSLAEALEGLTGTVAGTAYLVQVQYNDTTYLVVTQGTSYAEGDVVVKLVGVDSADKIDAGDLQ